MVSIEEESIGQIRKRNEKIILPVIGTTSPITTTTNVGKAQLIARK